MRRGRHVDPEHPAYDPSVVDADGHAACRRCLAPLPAGRQDFCSAACVHEFRIRASPAYARRAVFARDAGVCYHCRLDGGFIDRVLRRLAASGAEGTALALDIIANLGFGQRNRLISVWQADHRLAVAEGGADCGLGNYRTLCLRCHVAATRGLHARLRGVADR